MASHLSSSIQYTVLSTATLQPGQWSSHILNIYSAGPAVCFLSFFLPCIQFGRNQQKFKDIRHGNGSGCLTCCCLYGCLLGIGLFFTLPICHIIIHMNFRLQLRQLNQIRSYGDCCFVLFCSPCAMIQEATFLQVYEDQVMRSGNGSYQPQPQLYPQARVGYGHQVVVPTPAFAPPMQYIQPQPQPQLQPQYASYANYNQPVIIAEAVHVSHHTATATATAHSNYGQIPMATVVMA